MTLRRAFALIVVFVLAGMGSTLLGQRSDVSELRAQLLARYDVVPLKDGIALVPHARDSGVRMIEIAGGSVTIDGEAVTGKELTARLGRDAQLVLQASYLDRAAQKELAAASGSTGELQQQEPSQSRHTRYRDRVRFGGSIYVSKDELVDGEVVSIFGNASIDGEVSRDVTVVMGSLYLGPTAVVRGDVVVVGGQLGRAPTSVVSGSVDEINLGPGTWFSHAADFGGPGIIVSPRSWPFAPRAILAGTTVVRLVLLVLLGLVVLAVGRTGVERIGQRAAENPVRAGVVGLLAELLFIPALVATIVILAISIVGIPLLLLVPFGIAAFLVVMLIGFVGAAHRVGVALSHRIGLVEHGGFLALALGIVVVMAVTLIGRLAFFGLAGLVGIPIVALGYFIEYLAWTVGFGAAILTWFESRRARRVPPIAPPVAPVVPV